MHELSLCEDLLNQVMTIAEQHRARRVASVTVRIGPLAGVEPLLLENAFNISSAGTVAEEAEFVMEQQPIRVICEHCGAESDATASSLICAECGSCETMLLSGDELILARVELLNAD